MQPIHSERRTLSPTQLLLVIAPAALIVAVVSLLTSASPPDDPLGAGDDTVTYASGAGIGAMPVVRVELPGVSVAPTIDTTMRKEPAPGVVAGAVTSTGEQAAPEADATPAPSPAPAPAPVATPAPAPVATPAPARPSDPSPASDSAEPMLGQIKSKADEKGYDVHGHVEHSVVLLGQQVLIPGQAATGGFIQTSENNYMAYSPITAMLPVAIQDNKEVLAKKPNLEGEELYRRLAQEYTGSNDYKKLNRDAQRAINILTCTDWSQVEKRVRENTINHLLHSPISFGTIGSVENPISTDVTIDLGYTHTRDKNWTEVEYMGNNVYKITVVSNNNNGSHTGHAMGTAFVEMPAGTTLREAQKIGNRMIPSKNKNNKLTIDPAARQLFESLPRGASPMILFEHLSEEEQNAYFEGRGIEAVGTPNPDCNPLEGGILGSTPTPGDDPNQNSTTTTAPTPMGSTETTADPTPTTMGSTETTMGSTETTTMGSTETTMGSTETTTVGPDQSESSSGSG